MNLTRLTAIIEAVMFAAGEPIELTRLAEITHVDEETMKLAIERLANTMEDEESGIELIQVGTAYQMATKPNLYEYIVKLVEPRQQITLSNAAMEALSIIAYNQPVTKSSVEFIRGVNSDGAVNRLVERGLIEECGRLETPGKPILYQTTHDFLKTFGLKTIEELPNIENIPLQLTFYDMQQKNDEH